MQFVPLDAARVGVGTGRYQSGWKPFTGGAERPFSAVIVLRGVT